MRRSILFAAVFCSLYLSGIATGATIFVPADQPTIQAGIDAASTGDVVMVADGTYTGAGNVNLDFNGKAITVRSASDDPSACIIDCENASETRGFHFHNSETSSSIVRGLAIQNGNMNGSGDAGVGGGIYCYQSSPTITNCTISGNSAKHGGGICRSHSSSTTSNCTISGNSASGFGGGIYYQASSSPTLANCTISGNSTTDYGGGICCYISSSPTIANCTITENSAECGGGIRCWDSSSPTITNCTISGNSATENGGGICCNDYSSPTITDCILWSNSAIGDNEIYVSSGSPTADYCDIEGGCPPGVACSNCIDQDPQFVVGPRGDFYLDRVAKAVSPCINAGSDSASNICFTDSDGTVCMNELTTRIDGAADSGTVDMGFHYRPHSVLLVPADYPTIQAGIDAAADCDVVMVADGTYTGAGNVNLDFNGKAITVRSASDDPATCIIDCENASETRGFHFHNSETSSSVVRGLAIQNGNMDGGYPNNCGGGIYCRDSSSPTITNCMITENSAGYGGGISFESSSPTTVNCTISGNTAGYGGGIGCYVSSLPTITNCTISGNAAVNRGGGIHCESSSPTITNCTITENSATEYGGGIRCYYSSSPTIINCILWGNSAAAGNEIHVGSGSPTADYCDIEGGCPADVACSNCMNQDPQFVVGPRGDFYLDRIAKSVSPCINAGSDSASNICFTDSDGTVCMDELTTRIDGAADSGTVDMGFHYRLTYVLLVPADYPTIQAGIDAAADCDVVMVADGTYTGAGNVNLDFNGKAITVRSASDDPATCIIDCENASETRGFHFHNSETSSSIVRGLAIQNGNMNGSGDAGVGGGIYCCQSSPTITNCTISGNSAKHGGGILCTYSSSTITNCTISGNSATDFGGGIMYQASSSPTLANCAVTGNSATDYGGGICCYISSSPTIANCTIWNNTASSGGGIRCWDSSSPTITNCTITGNSAINHGGGIGCYNSSSPTITNCILWGDSASTGNEIYKYGGSPTANYCDIEGGCPADVACSNCISQDPQFVFGPRGDFYLDRVAKSVSPCINAGSDSASNICFTDSDGTVCMNELTTRIDGVRDLGTVDMGFHYRPHSVLLVPADYGAIQAGIDAAADGDVVMIADGTYTGAGNVNLDFNGKAIMVRSASDDPATCIIDCENASETRGFHFHNGETSSSIVRGLAIQNGNADWIYPNNYGGGIYCRDSSSPTIANCTISGSSSDYGGGIYCRDSSSPNIANCKILGNSAVNYGGGIYCNASSQTIANCTITGNSADYGGGIYCNASSPNIANCRISGNLANSGSGGGIYCRDSSSPTIANCTIWNNTANSGGGIGCHDSSPAIANCTISGNTANNGAGIYCRTSSSPTMTNCTISGNSADYGGGIGCDNASPTITNCILWGNSSIAGNEIHVYSGSPTADYCNIEGGCPAGVTCSNCIDQDPEFVVGPRGGFYLDHIAKAISPCIDAGSDLASNICFDSAFGQVCMDELTTRVDGVVDSGTVDIGFHYPYFHTTPTPTPTPTITPTSTCTPTVTPTCEPTITPTSTCTPTITPTCAPTITPTPHPHSGDVNGNGSVDPGDSYLALMIYLEMHPPGASPEAADFCPRPNGDGSVDPGDAYGILKEYLSIPDPCSW